MADEQLLGDANAGTYIPEFTMSNMTSPSSAQVSWSGLNGTLSELGFTGFSLIIDDIQRLFNVSETSESAWSLDKNEGELSISHVFR
jgi:hypothetical protein